MLKPETSNYGMFAFQPAQTSFSDSLGFPSLPVSQTSSAWFPTGFAQPVFPPSSGQLPLTYPGLLQAPTLTASGSPSKRWEPGASDSGDPRVQAKVTAYRLKWQQERERREALLKQSEAVLLNMKEWEERQLVLHTLQQQLMKDCFDRENVLENLSKNESAMLQLRKALQQAKDDEERQIENLRNLESEARSLRSQVTEQENQLVEEQTRYADQVEEAASVHETLKRTADSLKGAMSSLLPKCSTQLDRQRQIESQLYLANKELERLRQRVPHRYQSPGTMDTSGESDLPVPSTAAYIPQPSTRASMSCSEPITENIVVRTVTPGGSSDSVTHSMTSDTSGREAKSKPVIGMEVRENSGIVRVTAVSADGPAMQAGIRIGDVLKTWNGRNITSRQAYTRAVLGAGVAVPVKVEVSRPRGTGTRMDMITCMVTAKESRSKSC